MQSNMRGLVLVMVALVILAVNISAKALRDPFRPMDPGLVSRVKRALSTANLRSEITTLRLVGVIWDQKDPLAIIVVRGKQELMGVGSAIDTYVVNKVSPKEVILKGFQKTIILKLNEEIRL